MSSGTDAKLAYMANQIARNLAREADPARAVADHLAAFWTPAMIAALQAQGGAGLDPAAAHALALLAPRTAGAHDAG
ncbi:NAD-dependent formate dehydrogenase delta subunit [Novosphingobium lubricantis]|jgi:hypothetical protein